MKSRPASLLALALLLGCGHAKTTAKPPEKARHEEKEKAAPEREKHEAPANPHKTPVVESPEALLEPGAEDQIRAKLKADGLLEDEHGSLEPAIRKFQKANDLPATGVIDHETARKLGLDPARVFRRAEPSP